MAGIPFDLHRKRQMVEIFLPTIEIKRNRVN